ncbi:MAG: 3-oxoacyl-ACP reductase FabG [Bacillota bacterium]
MIKTVVITGSSRGIGAEIARVLAEKKYNIVINYKNNEARATALAKELAVKCRVITVKADISTTEGVNALYAATVSAFGGADYLVNNAGISAIGLLQDMSENEISNIINTNLTATLLVSRAFIPHMVSEKHGKIINISSMWGVVGASCEVAYSASKAGIIGCTKALAKELAPSGITVNCIAPGLIDTEINAHLSAEDLAAIVAETPVGRIGTTGDIAKSVAFLLSDDASFITGQTLTIDGGLTL